MDVTAKRIGIILLASALMAGVSNSLHPQRIPWVQDWSNQVEEQAGKLDIEVIALAGSLEKFRSGEALFVDARSDDLFERGHIPGALSIPFERLDEMYPALIDPIDSGKELVVYCTNRECDDALLLALELRTMGAANLALYIDGFEIWQKHIGEVER